MLLTVSVLAIAAVTTLIGIGLWRALRVRRARRHHLQTVFTRFIAANQVEAAAHPLIDMFLEDTADVDRLFPESELPRLRLELHEQASELRRLEDSLDENDLDADERPGIVEACREKRTWFTTLAHRIDEVFGIEREAGGKVLDEDLPDAQGLGRI